MRKLILTTAAALSIAAIPAFAGAQSDPSTAPAADTAAPDETAPAADTAVPVDQPAPVADTSVSATSTSTSVTTGAGASVDFQGADAAPAPPTSYPICKGKIQDECVNPREAGLNYGNRPLKYWPGHPASQ